MMRWFKRLISFNTGPKRKKIKVDENEYYALKQQAAWYYNKYKELKENK